MEDYRTKIENLPTDRLEDLAEVYRTTIKKIKETYNEAHMAAMTAVADYSQREIDKKQADLAAIEQILQNRKGSGK